MIENKLLIIESEQLILTVDPLKRNKNFENVSKMIKMFLWTRLVASTNQFVLFFRVSLIVKFKSKSKSKWFFESFNLQIQSINCEDLNKRQNYLKSFLLGNLSIAESSLYVRIDTLSQFCFVEESLVIF